MNLSSPKASFHPKTATASLRPLEKLSRNSRSTINLNKSKSEKQNTQRHSSPKHEMRLDQQLRNLVQRCEQSKNAIENINYSLHSKRFDMSPRDLEASKDLTQTILRNSTLSIFGSPPAAEKLGLNDLYSRKSAQNFFTSHKLDSEHSFSRSPIRRAPMHEHSNINFQKSPEKSKRYLSPIETEYLREDINNVLDALSPTEKFQKFKSMMKDEEDDKENENINLEIQYNELKKYLQEFIANVEDLEHRNKAKDQELLQLRTQAQNNIEELLVQKDIRGALEQRTKDLEANEEDIQEVNLNNNMKITAQDKKIKNLEQILYDEEFKLKHFKTKAQEENQELKRELFGLKEREKALNSTGKDMKDQIRELESKLNTAVSHSQYAEKSSDNKEEKIHILQQGINELSLQQKAHKRHIEDLESEINRTAERILEVRRNIKVDQEKVIKDANQEKMHRKQQSQKLKKEIQDSKMQANELIESNKLKRLRLGDVIRKRENLEKDKAEVKRKLDNIEDEKRFLTENLDKLKTQNSELLHNLKVQETKVKDTMKENNITQAKIQVIEGKLGYVDKVTKKAEELIKTLTEKRADLLQVSTRSKQHISDVENRIERLEENYKNERTNAEKKLVEITKDLTTLKEQKKVSDEACTKLKAEIAASKTNKESESDDYEDLKEENRALNKTIKIMKQDLELIIRRNQEREDERRRDIEHKKRIGQKIRVLTEIQDKIKDCKTEQKDKSFKYQ